MSNPQVSIYIPTKNRLELLRNAVRSVMAQSYPDWELIVVNDASTDETRQYLDALCKADSRIRAIHHEESKGAPAARNEALFSAGGEFVTGLDDDDWFEENRIESFLEAWKNKSKDTVLLFTGTKRFANGEFVFESRPEIKYIRQEDLLSQNPINNQVFTKLAYMKQIEGFDPLLRMWQDLDCWFRLLTLGKGEYIDNTSYCFDISDRADRISKKKEDELIKTYNYFNHKYKLHIWDSVLLKEHFKFYGVLKDNRINRFKKRCVIALKQTLHLHKIYGRW